MKCYMYSRLGNRMEHYKDFIGYIYVKDSDHVSLQLQDLYDYCNRQDIKLSKVHIDIGDRKRLKHGFKDLLRNNKDCCIIISKPQQISRDIVEYAKCVNMCLKNNIGIYSFFNEEFLTNTYSKILGDISKKVGDRVQRKIKVLVVEPNKLPYEKIIDNNLHTKQELVGGLIEYTYMLDDDSVCLVCNEEGKLMGLELNRSTGHDVIAGTFFVVGYDDSGEDRSLSDEQIEQYKNRFGKQSIKETEEIVSKIILEKDLAM